MNIPHLITDISSEVAHTTYAFIMFLGIIAAFVLFYCCITSDSDIIVHAQNAQWFLSASKMVIPGIVPENSIDMPRNSILNPHLKAFVSKEREKSSPYGNIEHEFKPYHTILSDGNNCTDTNIIRVGENT